MLCSLGNPRIQQRGHVNAKIPNASRRGCATAWTAIGIGAEGGTSGAGRMVGPKSKFGDIDGDRSVDVDDDFADDAGDDDGGQSNATWRVRNDGGEEGAGGGDGLIER